MPKCKMYKQLLFLKDTVMNRSTCSNLSAEKSFEIESLSPPPTPSSDNISEVSEFDFSVYTRKKRHQQT